VKYLKFFESNWVGRTSWSMPDSNYLSDMTSGYLYDEIDFLKYSEFLKDHDIIETDYFDIKMIRRFIYPYQKFPVIKEMHLKFKNGDLRYILFNKDIEIIKHSDEYWLIEFDKRKETDSSKVFLIDGDDGLKSWFDDFFRIVPKNKILYDRYDLAADDELHMNSE